MLFNSFSFIVFFPVVVIGYFFVPHKIRYIWLLICSYYFYMSWNPKYALLILASTAITYFSGLGICHVNEKYGECVKAYRYKKLCVAGSAVFNIGLLAHHQLV